MRVIAGRIAAYLLVGMFLNLAIAWSLVAAYGSKKFEWNPYLNPRAGDPVAFFVIRRPGVEWVVGCGRPGTLLDTATSPVPAKCAPWWPAEAVTFNDDDCASAAGWPMLALSTWRTTTTTITANNDLDVKPVHAWGLTLSEPTLDGWDELPAVLPMRPILPGLVVDSVFWAAISGGAVEGARALRRRGRLAAGACVRCRYPVAGLARCPECGSPCSATPAASVASKPGEAS